MISESKDHLYYFHIHGAKRPILAHATHISSILGKFSWRYV